MRVRARWIREFLIVRTYNNCRLYVLQNFLHLMPSRAISSKADAFFLGFLFRSRFIGLNPFFASPCGSKPTFFLLLSIKLVEASPIPLRDHGDLLRSSYYVGLRSYRYTQPVSQQRRTRASAAGFPSFSFELQLYPIILLFGKLSNQKNNNTTIVS